MSVKGCVYVCMYMCVCVWVCVCVAWVYNTTHGALVKALHHVKHPPIATARINSPPSSRPHARMHARTNGRCK